MVKRDRMRMIEELELLKEELEGYISASSPASIKVIDCKKVVDKIDELIRHVAGSSKIESDVLVKIAKMKNITKSVQRGA